MLKFNFEDTKETRKYIKDYIEKTSNLTLDNNDIISIVNDLQNDDDLYNEVFNNLEEYLDDQIENQ